MTTPDYAHGIQSSFLATMTARRLAAKADAIQTVQVTPQVQTADAGGGDNFFNDVLDIINPLQHIPVVSTLYRAITGDKIGDFEQVAGDGIYGGLMGLASSVGNIIFREATGKTLGDTVLAWAEDTTGIHLGDSQPTALADAKPATDAAKLASASPSTPTTATASPPATAAARPRLAAIAPLVPQLATKPPASLASAQPPQVIAAAAAAAPASVTPAQAAQLPGATMLTNPSAFMAMLKARGVDPALGMRAMSAYQKTLGEKSLALPQ